MRLLRIVVNWTIVFTMPVWCGLVTMGLLLYEGVKGGRTERSILSGKEWFW